MAITSIYGTIGSLSADPLGPARAAAARQAAKTTVAAPRTTTSNASDRNTTDAGKAPGAFDASLKKADQGLAETRKRLNTLESNILDKLETEKDPTKRAQLQDGLTKIRTAVRDANALQEGTTSKIQEGSKALADLRAKETAPAEAGGTAATAAASEPTAADKALESLNKAGERQKAISAVDNALDNRFTAAYRKSEIGTRFANVVDIFA